MEEKGENLYFNDFTANLEFLMSSLDISVYRSKHQFDVGHLIIFFIKLVWMDGASEGSEKLQN